MPAHMIEDPSLDTASQNTTYLPHLEFREDVVISGISGRLPESDNIAEFREHLRKCEDMVTDDDRRWPPGLHGLPERSGKLKDVTKFDASFFGVHPKQANGMDPQLRMLLEVTHEAIVDAGVNPQSVRGTKTGVFIGCSASESHDAWSSDVEKIVGYEMTGCTRSMFANRLSYFFDFKGPSYAIDTACSSSLLALDQAFMAIRTGQCDAAIVGGSNLCLRPSTSLQFQKLGMLSPEGTCKSFDVSGNGYCRSEAVVAVYLQKAVGAKRIYASLVHAKNNSDGNKEQGITFPNGEIQKRLLKEVYNEANVDPATVAYVEAHGTGTKAGDPQELNSIVDVFCKGRQGPLLVGSTKSNMGHPEPASGLAALAKILIAMEDRQIPANLHYKSPNPDIPGLSDGRLRVVSEPTNWEGGYAAVNSFGFGGSNVHALLKSNQRPVHAPHEAAELPRVFLFSARTEEGLQNVLETVQNEHAQNVELQALLADTANTSALTHPYRGYATLNTDNKVKETLKCPGDDRPIWFVFAGMGTQWHGMGRDLMQIDVFRDSIKSSDRLLQQYGIKLYDMLMEGDDTVFHSTLNSFVGIAAIQVALVNLLRAYGIEPDGIVGHSVGELGCAYADGGLTAEETVLAAYWRGRCVKEANLPPGGMAAVGLTWGEAKERCPEGVVAACHNAIDTVTISGPAEKVTEFVAELKAEGTFAKEVHSAGVAFHSYYMAKTAPALKLALEKVIKEPRLRSSRWISSSIPESHWNLDLAKYSSASYHVNNLVSPVLFQEALQHVPQNAIVIEIAPHCLLQAILKRSLATSCTIVGLMKRNHPNNVEFFYSSLGKCYMNGMNFSPLRIFAPVQYPVSRGTPMVAPLVQWDHSQTWDVPKDFPSGGSSGGKGCVFEIDASPSSEDHYLVGHCIDGRVLFPATGYLVLAWRALAKMKGQMYEQLPVVFEDVHIHRATILPKSGTVKLEVNIMEGSGKFEVVENGAQVVTGRIYVPTEPHMSHLDCQKPEPADPSLIQLTTSDIYKELRLRGYDYGPTFQGILSASNIGDDGYLLWNGNWISFLDTMLQMSIVSHPGRGLRLPTRIKSIRIDPSKHEEAIHRIDDERQAIKVVGDDILHICAAGGVEMFGLHTTVAPRRQQTQSPPVLEEFHFVPYVEKDISKSDKGLTDYLADCETLIKTNLKNVLDNTNGWTLPNMDTLKKLAVHNSGASSLSKGDFEKYEAHAECCIMKVMKEVFSQPLNSAFSDNVRNILNTNQSYLHDDVLLNNLLSPRTLKPMLDIVIENSSSQKVNVVEVGASAGQLYSRVIPHLTTQPMLNINYIATDSSVDSLNQEALESLNARSAKWDLKSSPPNNVTNAHVLVANNILHNQADIPEALKFIAEALHKDGFLLLNEFTSNFTIPLSILSLTKDVDALHERSCSVFMDEMEWVKVLNEANFEVVSQKSDGLLSTLFLCRKRSDVPAIPTMLPVDDLSFCWVDELKTKMQEHGSAEEGRTLWLRADKVAYSGIVGMVNCLRQEPGGDRVRCIFNASLDGSSLPDLNAGSPEMKNVLSKNLVMNVFRNGNWGSFRHIPFNKDEKANTETPHAYVNVLTRGDLSSLRWIESPLKYFSKPTEGSSCDKQLCSVYYTSLNFRDIMLATGKLPPDAIPGDMASQDCILGMEISGRNENGERIMGLLPAKGLATTVDADSRFLWSVPDHWTLEEAASVPVVYATVYYALVIRGRIKKGNKVLIHSGSGGVGQAAISVALHQGCEVYTTVGSKEKREYLKQRFPQLTDRNFSNSRDTSFEFDIMRATNGKGVDVVLNSLAEEKLQASLRVLAQHGRFLEIGKFDLSNNSSLGMAVFLRNISFHGILLDSLFDEGNDEWGEVSALLSQGIKSGAVQPLKTTVFDKDDIEGAFRFMAQGKHIGKVVVKIREEEKEKVTQPAPVSLKAIPKTLCHPHKTYIITGGLGGFGLELAQWLVEHGAKNIVLSSRSGVKSGYQSRKLRLWQEQGIRVCVSTKNIVSLDGAEGLIDDALKIGPVGGVFHLAMVLRDGFLENQTVENFQTVGASKVSGTRHLDQVTRKLCSETLDMFVVFSSVSCGRGNAGQTNYGFANSFMERVCEQRRHDGLPGLAVQWGAIGDVGVVLDTMGNNDTVIGGTLPQRITSCLAALDTFLNQPHPVMSSFVLAERASGQKSDQSNKTDLVQSITHILGVKDPSTVNPDTTLADLGLDSLMGVEVKQTLERDYDLGLSMKEIRLLTINKLKEIAGGSSTAQSPEKEVDKSTDSTQSGGSFNDSGVSMRYDLNQIMPTKDIVHMNGISEGNPLFIIHPIEGVLVSLESLVGSVKCPVYGLQCTAEAPLTSVQDLAAYYLQHVQKVQPQGPYQLAGYSFGGSIALEMALQLQKAQPDVPDIVKSLIFLDASHSYVSAHTQQHRHRLQPGNEGQAESEALCLFMLQFTNIDYAKLSQDLQSQPDFDSRVKLTVSTVMASTSISNQQDLEAAAVSFFRKLYISEKYQPEGSYQGGATLVRAQNGRQQAETLGSDYGLGKVCTGPVAVHVVDGDHETFILGKSAEKVAQIMTDVLV